MTTPATTVQALRRAAATGPYFAVSTAIENGAWRPFRDLFDADVLGENVDIVQRVLSERTGIPDADLDRRACASTHFLGLVSRLVAPALGAAAVAGHMPVFEPEGLAWQRVDGGPVPIAVRLAGGVDVADPVVAAVAFDAGVVETVVAPLEAVFESAFALSPLVLWGNVASAIAGAATMLARTGQAFPLDPGPLARAITARGALIGMGEWTSAGYVRHNCCLFYKIPGGGKCGDCVL